MDTKGQKKRDYKGLQEAGEAHPITHQPRRFPEEMSVPGIIVAQWQSREEKIFPTRCAREFEV